MAAKKKKVTERSAERNAESPAFKDDGQTEGNTPKVDYKDSTLHQDLAEIKLLLGCMLKDIDKLSANIDVIKDIEEIRAGRKW